MNVAALIAWIVTAGGGFYLLAIWLSRGGTRADGASRFPAGLIFGHFGLAAVGLVLWIIFLIGKATALAWIAFIILVPVAALGFTMLLRWLPAYRGRSDAVPAGPGTPAAPAPAEGHFPPALVVGHGLLAVATVVLVLIAALKA